VLKKAIQEQVRLRRHVLPSELVERSVPILWFGRPQKGNWVTIATNPSGNEFLDKGVLREGRNARLYHLSLEETLEGYFHDEKAHEQTINSFLGYYQKNPYVQWFGKERGARLEGFLNGLGGSLYGVSGFHPVVHTDFMPFATKEQFSKLIKNNQTLERKLTRSSFTKEFLHETLQILEPSMIILLGKQNYSRYLEFDRTYSCKSNSIMSVTDYPEAKFEIGWSKMYESDVLTLYFKPSEQFIGLSRKVDGSYQSSDGLRKIGEFIKAQLEESNSQVFE
jgi:hypothetical protein